MGLRGLAEGIILQCIEDLWHETLREESVAFFRSEDFTVCAAAAGMELIDQVKLLNMVKGIIDRQKEEMGSPRSIKNVRLRKWQKEPMVSYP